MVTQHEHQLHFNEQRPRAATPENVSFFKAVLLHSANATADIYIFLNFLLEDRQTYHIRQSLDRAIWCEINIKILMGKLFFFFLAGRYQVGASAVKIKSVRGSMQRSVRRAERAGAPRCYESAEISEILRRKRTVSDAYG